MNISEFAFNILLIFFPGIICAYLVDMFTNGRDRTQFMFLINAFLLGFGSYLIYSGTIYFFVPDEVRNIAFINAISEGKVHISIREILKVCVISVILGILIIIINQHKLHSLLFQRLHITSKFGELDVWGFLMNSPNTGWVTVRDLENNIMYDGWVKVFSDNGKEAELLLVEVSVYKNDTGQHLYDIDAQYLSLNRDKIRIEIRSTS